MLYIYQNEQKQSLGPGSPLVKDPKIGDKSKLQNLCITFLRNPMKILHAKFVTMLTVIVAFRFLYTHQL